MKMFRILRHPLTNDLKAIKVGFSFPGFFFHIFWGIYHKFWPYVITVFAIVLVSVIIDETKTMPKEINDIALNIISWIISIATGFKGNEWITSNYIKNGYKYVGDIIAPNKDLAIIMWSEKNKNSTPNRSGAIVNE